ncbi:MAG TPA: acyl-CoA dehydrogenase family protein [Caldilineaceae bacterium]|nr:acyl-CoA dehydrogenase family protein [Caldilineaceae bacterium]
MIETQPFPTERTEKRQRLLHSVEAIRPTLVQSAHESECNATLAPAAVAALQASGLFNLKLPTTLGGAEADPVLQIEVLEALAYIDTASAWCTMISATGIAILGAFLPELGLQQLFANGRIPIAVNTIHPVGCATPVAGGYRVSGHWRFCSGIRHADWVFCTAAIQRPEGSYEELSLPERILVTMPVCAVTIHDNWSVVGLRGTGSCDISVAECFVPHDLAFQRDRLNPTPLRGGPYFHLASPGFLAQDLIGFALGIARRALDELINGAIETKSTHRPAPLCTRPIIHRLVGKYELTLQAARSLAIERYAAVMQKLEAGESIDLQCQAQLQALATYTTELAVEIAAAAFRYGGGRALYQPNILERLMRDSQAAAQHAFVSDQHYESYGKFLVAI